MRTSPRPNCAAAFKLLCAPDDSVNNCWKFCVASGNARIVVVSIACPVVASLVSTVCTSAWTSIFCCTASVVSLIVSRVVSVTRTTTSATLPAANPEEWISTRYVPTGSRGAVKLPSGSVVIVRCNMFVSCSVMRTSAFATTAPLGSCTVPVIAPVAPPCAKAAAVSAKATTLITMNLIEEPDILSLPSPCLILSCFYRRFFFRRHRQTLAVLGLARTLVGRIPARSLESKDLISAIALWKQLCLVNDLLGFPRSLQNRPADFQEKNAVRR